MSTHSDLVIVGGGPVGATLALAMRDSGLSVQVLEARPAGAVSTDPRALALSEGSRLILERLGVWQSLLSAATPIHTIHVSQRGRLGRTELHAKEEGLESLGYVVPYAALSGALDAALDAAHDIQVVNGAQVQGLDSDAACATATYRHEGVTHHACAPLVVMADGGRSVEVLPGMIRKTREYGHSAVIAQVVSELPHRHVAYERFTEAGPAALLPSNGDHEFALVWTAGHEAAQDLCELDDEIFLTRLHAHFGDRVGRFTAVGRRQAFPLRLTTTRPVVAPHLAVIGNAAQTLHPVAGQGFNLGLRDAWELAAQIIHGGDAIGSPEMLAAYRKRRSLDTTGGIAFTDFLVKMFSNKMPGLGHMRGAGLILTDMIPPARHMIARKMSFGAAG